MKTLIWIIFLSVTTASYGQRTPKQMKFENASDAVILLPKGQESYLKFLEEKRLSKDQMYSLDSLRNVFNTFSTYSIDISELTKLKDSIDEKNYKLVEENILIGRLVSSVNEIFNQIDFLNQDFTRDFIKAAIKTKDMDIKVYCSESVNRIWTLILTNKNGIESILLANILSPNIADISSGFLNLKNKIENTNTISFLRDPTFDISTSETRANEYLKKIQNGLSNFKELLFLSKDYTKNLSSLFENNYYILINNVPLKYFQILKIKNQ